MRFAPAFAPPPSATGAKPDTASAEISTDVSYLPDLTAYLDDLLRSREKLAAAINGVDDWARADATPAQEEITRIRRLINRIKGDLADLGGAENTAIDEAIAVLRRHRAVSLAMPSIRPGAAPHTRVIKDIS